MTPTRMILLMITLLLLGSRWIALDSTPFINDEPKIQSALDHHLEGRHFPTHGLMGTRGVTYGPTAQWLYTPVRLITDRVGVITGFHVFYFAWAVCLVFFALCFCLGLEIALWTALLVSSSPYLFFYSRLPWDNTLIILTSALCFALIAGLEKTKQTWTRRMTIFGLGLASGLVFNTHLMGVPVVIASGMCTVLYSIRFRESRWEVWRGGAVFGLGFLFVSGMYLVELAPELIGSVPDHPSPWTRLETLYYLLKDAVRFLSSRGMDYFIRVPQDRLVPKWVMDLSRVLLIAVGLGAALGFGLLARRRVPLVLVWIWGLVFVFLGYYMILKPYPLHPHYFMPLWFAGALCFVYFGLEWRRRGVRPFFYTVATALIACNLLYVWNAHAWIEHHGGTRQNSYGTVRSEIERQVGEICTLAAAHPLQKITIDLSSVPGVMEPSVEFYLKHLPYCRNLKTIDVGGSGEGKVARLHYLNDDAANGAFDAHLKVEWTQ